jgi:hypothetical protein
VLGPHRRLAERVRELLAADDVVQELTGSVGDVGHQDCDRHRGQAREVAGALVRIDRPERRVEPRVPDRDVVEPEHVVVRVGPTVEECVVLSVVCEQPAEVGFGDDEVEDDERIDGAVVLRPDVGEADGSRLVDEVAARAHEQLAAVVGLHLRARAADLGVEREIEVPSGGRVRERGARRTEDRQMSTGLGCGDRTDLVAERLVRSDARGHGPVVGLVEIAERVVRPADLDPLEDLLVRDRPRSGGHRGKVAPLAAA